jgi:hypothetical protein
MKKTDAPVGWMERLDREEVWSWGTLIHTFAQNVQFYLKALEALGRPIETNDRHGPWSKAFSFWTKYRTQHYYNSLPLRRQKILDNLPYFFDSGYLRKAMAMTEELVQFKVCSGHLPRAGEPGEVRLYQAHHHLRKKAKQGKLPERLLHKMRENGLLQGARETHKATRLSELRQFVEQYKRWPGHSIPGTEEHQLYYTVYKIVRRSSSSHYSGMTVKDLRTIPGCPF